MDFRQRTREGIRTARLNGKVIGRPKGAQVTTKKSIEMKEIIEKHSRDFSGTLTDVEIMKITGLTRNTYYKYKRELKDFREYRCVPTGTRGQTEDLNPSCLHTHDMRQTRPPPVGGLVPIHPPRGGGTCSSCYLIVNQ